MASELDVAATESRLAADYVLRCCAGKIAFMEHTGKVPPSCLVTVSSSIAGVSCEQSSESPHRIFVIHAEIIVTVQYMDQVRSTLPRRPALHRFDLRGADFLQRGLFVLVLRGQSSGGPVELLVSDTG